MFKRHLKLVVRGNEDRLYELHVDEYSPLGEVYDVLQTMLAVVMKKMEDNAPKKDECAKEECCESQCCDEE